MTVNIPWDRVTPKLIEKWGGQAPRYTSYPTALEWTDEFQPADFDENLTYADESPDAPVSIYVHIPFCKKRCLFCGCASDVIDDTSKYDTYLDALSVEIAQTAEKLPHRRTVAGLHLGGGTPTVLDGPRMQHLLSVIARCFDFSRVSEMALEAAPSVTHMDQVDTLAILGFNRISFGVQDFTKKVQLAVNRIQTVEHTAALVEQARRHRMGVNIDLMYGLPHQTLNAWGQTLKQVIELNPDRLAVFGYAHVPWMRPHQQQLDERAMPDGTLRLALFRAAHEALTDAGYIYVGMDHFARPNDPLALALEAKTLWRNFQGYTLKQAQILLGFGATAISDLEHAFAQNTVAASAYQNRIKESGNATFRGHQLSKDDQLRRQIITELMCNLQLHLSKIETEFGINFWDYFESERTGLEQLASDGLVELDIDRIEITGLGRMFVRHVGLVFDRYSNEKIKQAKFSRTV